MIDDENELNRQDRVLLIDMVYRIVSRAEKRMDDLRVADLRAIEVAHEVLRERMEGFPQLYATKAEQDGIKETAQRLEKDSVSREIYDTNHAALRQEVSRKLEQQVFDATLSEWVTWRRQVEQRLAAQSGVSAGVSRTFYWALAGLGGVATAVAIILSFNS